MKSKGKNTTVEAIANILKVTPYSDLKDLEIPNDTQAPKTIYDSLLEFMESVTEKVIASRSLLDLAIDYIEAGQAGEIKAERLNTILIALKKAREEALAAELELCENDPVYQLLTEQSKTE